MKQLMSLRALIGILILSLLQYSVALTATDADSLVLKILAQSGKNGGIVELPKAGDGQLARAFIQKSSLLVHAMCEQNDQVTTVRNLVESTNQVGIRVYVEKGSPRKIPLSDNYADLVVITNLLDNDLTTIPIAEMVRALSPGGQAYIGRAAGEGSGLSITALQNWLQGTAGASASTDSKGTFAVITKSKPASMDEWTHTFHLPDNNPVSKDSIQWPYLPQFRAKPVSWRKRHGNVVAAGGRLYVQTNDAYGIADVKVAVRAFKVYNGQMLWKKDLGSVYGYQIPTNGALMAATESKLYCVNQNKVDEIDGESGLVTRSFIPETTTESQVKWVAIAGGLLYTLSGPKALDSLPVIDNNFKCIYQGRTIAAYNLANGSKVWTHVEPVNIESREIALSNSKLYFIARNTRVVSLNALTGQQVWENTTPSVINLLEASSRTATDPAGSYPGFIVTPTTILNCQSEDNNLVALTSTNGQFLWSVSHNNNRSQAKIVLDNGILVNKDVDSKTTWDLINNQAAPVEYANYQKNMGGSCGVVSASVNGVYNNGGGLSYIIPKSMGFVQPFKTSCSIGMTITNGTVINSNTTDCVCTKNRGLVSESSAGAFIFDQEAVLADRLEKGVAYTDLITNVTVDSLDWSTYRANMKRTGNALVDLPGTFNLTMLYSRPVSFATPIAHGNDVPDLDNTPPVTAGNRVYWGSSDGFIHCQLMGSSTEQWRYPTGGKIYAAPTVAAGCVYVGSMDGYVYALEAHTGRLVWRFRAAPDDRRITLFGYLASIWPVNSGIVYKNNTVYFAAGISEGYGYGTHVYALNAKTGDIVWQNNKSGIGYTEATRMGVNPAGFMAASDSKLYLQSNPRCPADYDLITGEFSATAVKQGDHNIAIVRGREIGILDNKHIIAYGRYQYADNFERAMGPLERPITAMDGFQLDATTNVPKFPQSEIVVSCTRAASWDNGSMFMAVTGSRYLEKWSISNVTALIDKNIVDYPVSSWPAWKGMRQESGIGENGVVTPYSQWRLDIEMNGIALAKNGIAVTYAKNSKTQSSVALWNWYVAVIDRDLGSIKWETALPSPPVHEGIAISRNGTIVVTLQNGDVRAYGSDGAVSIIQRMPSNSKPDVILSQTNFVTGASVAAMDNVSPTQPVNAGTSRFPVEKPTYPSPHSVDSKSVPAIHHQRGLLREYWSGIGGDQTADLTNEPSYPGDPTDYEIILRSAVPADWAMNYGERIRGYIIPPETGKYRFSIQAENNATLMMSRNDNPINSKVIAKIGDNESSSLQTVKSDQILLEKGTKYYIEILHKVGLGKSKCMVSWTIPGKDDAVINSMYLRPFERNAVTAVK